MKTKDKYLKETLTVRPPSKRKPQTTVFDLNKIKKDKKNLEKKAAKNLNARIVKMMNNVIDISAHYRDGLVTREEYKDFLKDVMKVI